MRILSANDDSSRQYICNTELAKLVLSVLLAARQLANQRTGCQTFQVKEAVAWEGTRRESKTTALQLPTSPTSTIDVPRRRSIFPTAIGQSTSPCGQWKDSSDTSDKVETLPYQQGLLSSYILGRRNKLVQEVWSQTFSGDFFKMAIPACLFSLQNMLM